MAGRNDVIFLTGTVHLTSAVNWTKNNVHLVGLCAPLKNGKRARIIELGQHAIQLSGECLGERCLFQNFGTFYGFPTTGATTPICWNDTGGRNDYNLVEFLGFGDATVTTGTANQLTARAFVLNTSTGETTCVVVSSARHDAAQRGELHGGDRWRRAAQHLRGLRLRAVLAPRGPRRAMCPSAPSASTARPL